MKQPPQPWEFRSKKAWQRLLIMTGGVLFNILLAMFLYTVILFTWGETYLATRDVRYGIVTDSLGHAMGLRDGDKILTVDNEYIENFHAITKEILLNERTSIQVERDGNILSIPVKPEHIPLMLKGQGRIDARVPFGPFIINGFMKNSQASESGLAVGDEVKGIDGYVFEFNDQFQSYLAKHKGIEVSLSVLRDGDEITVPVTVTPEGLLGVMRNPLQTLELTEVRYGFLESIPRGIGEGFKTIGDYLKQFKLIFSRQTKGYESLGGFLTIGSIFPEVWNWHNFWNLTALLSVILAIMNILPIPALDGGHVMFLLYEVISGRKPSDKFMEYAQITGMILVFSILIYANGNDIVKFILRKWF
jgi:regulator of sigma E protease